MAKQSGLGSYFAVDNSAGSLKDISNDVVSLDINIAQNLLDVTGIDKSAMERLIGLGDGTITVNGVYNSAANMSHDVFKTRTGTRTVTYAVGGNTQGNPVISMEMLITSYVPVNGADGSLNWTAGLSLSNGTTPTWSTVA
jgi:hypothetical protein